MEETNLVHVSVIIKTEYDLNKETNEILNVKNTVLKSDEIEFENKRKRSANSTKEPQKAKTTIEDLSEQTNLAIAYIKQSSIKFTKLAAKVLGAVNENGEVLTTPNGKNVRVRTRYIKDSETKVMYPVMDIVDNDNPDKLPTISNSLVVSCNGRDNEILSAYGYFYVVVKAACGDMAVLKFYNSMEELAESNGITLPEDFVVPKDSLYVQNMNSNKPEESQEETLQANTEQSTDEAQCAPDNQRQEEDETNLPVSHGEDEELNNIIGNALSEVKSDLDDNENNNVVDDSDI